MLGPSHSSESGPRFMIHCVSHCSYVSTLKNLIWHTYILLLSIYGQNLPALDIDLFVDKQVSDVCFLSIQQVVWAVKLQFTSLSVQTHIFVVMQWGRNLMIIFMHVFTCLANKADSDRMQRYSHDSAWCYRWRDVVAKKLQILNHGTSSIPQHRRSFFNHRNSKANTMISVTNSASDQMWNMVKICPLPFSLQIAS